MVPGTHREGEFPTYKDHTIADDLIAPERPIVLSAQPGDVAIIHVLVVHRAGHNYTQRGRHAIINEYKSAAAIDQWNNRCAFAGCPWRATVA